MMDKEKRKHPRVPTNNPLSYVSLDEKGKPIEEGMGVTIDISQGGALLETGREINGKYVMLISIDLKKNVIQTKAKVIHCKSVGDSKFHTGIQFLGPVEDTIRLIKNLILDYHRRKSQSK